MFVAASRNRSDSASRANAAPPSCVSVRSARGADRRGQVDAQRAPLGARELGHDVRPLCVVVGCANGPVREPSGRAVPIRTAGREALHAKEGSPSFAADRSDGVGLRTRAAEDASVLCRLSYVPKDGGTRTRNHLDPEGTPACAAGRLDFKERDNCRGIVWLRGQVRTRTSWFRARCGSSSTTSHRSWSGRRDSNSQPPAPEAGALPVAPRPGRY